MATVDLIHFKFQNIDGDKYPLKIRITQNRSKVWINLKIYVHENDFDDKKGLIKKCKDFPSQDMVNSVIRNKINFYRDYILDLERSNRLNSLTASQIKAMLINTDTSHVSIKKFGEQKIKEYKKLNRHGSADDIYALIKLLERFNKKKEYRFTEIDENTLKEIEYFYTVTENKSINGLASRLKTLRTLYNLARKEKVIPVNCYPFTFYKIKRVQTRKRALPHDIISDFYKIELPNDLDHIRKLFFASYFMRGISFKDLSLLKDKNRVGDRIFYARNKLSQNTNNSQLSIQVIDKLEEIIEHFKPLRYKEFIFPIITENVTSSELFRYINCKRRSYNYRLQKIFKQYMEIDIDVSSYWGRHSWATSAKKKGIPIEVISEGLGHSNIKTTQIYLDSFENDTLDDANKKVSDF